jgi:hypothetical protein
LPAISSKSSPRIVIVDVNAHVLFGFAVRGCLGRIIHAARSLAENAIILGSPTMAAGHQGGCRVLAEPLDWIYSTPAAGAPPRRRGSDFTLPARVFGLPKRHIIEHAAADSDDHLTFHLWAFSFFTGMRLIATEAGFVDATRRR